jgi:hypothetical protein
MVVSHHSPTQPYTVEKALIITGPIKRQAIIELEPVIKGLA